MLTDMGERALVSTDAFEAKLVGMGEDVAFDMFVEPDAAAGLGHANRNLGSFTAILLGLPCHCRRTHTDTNGNSRRRHRGGSGRPLAISV